MTKEELIEAAKNMWAWHRRRCDDFERKEEI